MLRSFTILLLFLAAKTSYSQTYESEIRKAGNAYDRKNYDSCSYYFSNAFRLKAPAGTDLYNAAVCNMLNGDTRQTFDLLFKAIRNGANISKLKIDPDFETLHRSSKWKGLLKQANRIQIDSFTTYQYPSYAAQLAELWEADQSIRFRLANAYKNNDTILANQLWKKMRSSDSIVLLKFQPIIDKIGWPTRMKVGSRGAATAFLIIDHSPREVMEKYFPLLETAAKNGEASLSNYATLKDRVLINRGKKQVYGTQKFWDNRQAKFVFFEIEDEKNVNKLRKEVGLEPLKEFDQ